MATPFSIYRKVQGLLWLLLFQFTERCRDFCGYSFFNLQKGAGTSVATPFSIDWCRQPVSKLVLCFLLIIACHNLKKTMLHSKLCKIRVKHALSPSLFTVYVLRNEWTHFTGWMWGCCPISKKCLQESLAMCTSLVSLNSSSSVTPSHLKISGQPSRIGLNRERPYSSSGFFEFIIWRNISHKDFRAVITQRTYSRSFASIPQLIGRSQIAQM